MTKSIILSIMYILKDTTEDWTDGFKEIGKTNTFFFYPLLFIYWLYSNKVIMFSIMNSRFDISEKTWKQQKEVNKIPDLLNQSDRKITRNQKRRHDEINHVQMVIFL